MDNGGNGGDHGRPVNVRILNTGAQLKNLKLKPSYIAGPLLALAVLYGLMTSFYTVPQDSVALVQRFGAYNREAGPGLNFRIPFGFERISLYKPF